MGERAATFRRTLFWIINEVFTLIRTTLTQSLDELRPTLAAWDELVQRRPMRSPAWMLNWWNHYTNASRELCVLWFHASDELVGVAPLFRESIGNKRVYRLLGSGDVCTDHTTWFARGGYEQAVGKAVAQYFMDCEPGSRLHLEAVDSEDAALAATESRLREMGALVRGTPTLDCWRLELPETWEDYLQMLSKSHRKRCRRLLRSYFDAGRIVVRHAQEENLEAVWQSFLELHAVRWGDRQRPAGAFSPPRFQRFHQDLTRQLLGRGQLRLCLLELDGQPVAAEYQFFDHDTLYAYQSGMTAETDGQPGNLSLIATIQFALERGLKRLDFLRGNEPYKAHWRATPQACRDLRVWPKGIAGRFEIGVLEAKRFASSWLAGSAAESPS